MHISNIRDKLFHGILLLTERVRVFPADRGGTSGQRDSHAMQLAIGFPRKVGPQ